MLHDLLMSFENLDAFAVLVNLKRIQNFDAVHYIAEHCKPCIIKTSTVVQLPDIVQPMADNHICELESFGDVFLPPSNDIPFSAVDLSCTIRVGLPPRIVSRRLLEQTNAHDFVGCVKNPTWRRGSSHGMASRAAAGIRNLCRTRKIDIEGQSALAHRPTGNMFTTKVTARGSGQNWLPKAYGPVEIKQSQFKLKYEEFDFSYYNKTRFAGLENDIVNSYCNALLQQSRRMSVKEDSASLVEPGFVLHMLDLAPGGTCQCCSRIIYFKHYVRSGRVLRSGRIVRKSHLLSRFRASIAFHLSRFIKKVLGPWMLKYRCHHLQSATNSLAWLFVSTASVEVHLMRMWCKSACHFKSICRSILV